MSGWQGVYLHDIAEELKNIREILEKPSSLWYLDESSGTWRPLESMGTISTLTEDLTTGKRWTYSDIETRFTDTCEEWEQRGVE